ncbi:hypothetical protein WN55_05079 [Dufourea novaeangliae]|uniref:Uncharacterized protein n=1 Tax=Dufourea novaeangliae TaxID=178035 RepID=A0A154PP58_DUFNO|nr:hypothetical protein WN55_05079 [Dufourea novaeangliae]
MDATFVALLQYVLACEQQRVQLIVRSARAECQNHVRGDRLHHVHRTGELVVLPVSRGSESRDPDARFPGYVRYPEGVLEVTSLLGPQKPQRRVLEGPQLDNRTGVDDVRSAYWFLGIAFMLQHFHHVPLAHYLKSIQTGRPVWIYCASTHASPSRYDARSNRVSRSSPRSDFANGRKDIATFANVCVCVRVHVFALAARKLPQTHGIH